MAASSPKASSSQMVSSSSMAGSSGTPSLAWSTLYDPEWTFLPTEDVLSAEMKDKVRKDLKYYYHFWRNQVFRQEIRTFLYGPDPVLKDSSPIDQLRDTYQLKKFFNKATMLYYELSAQLQDECRVAPFCGIYNEWFRSFGGDPNIEFKRFFLSQVRITSAGPTTITDILDAHKSMCG
jgi:hypothetical protein